MVGGGGISWEEKVICSKIPWSLYAMNVQFLGKIIDLQPFTFHFVTPNPAIGGRANTQCWKLRQKDNTGEQKGTLKQAGSLAFDCCIAVPFSYD